MHNRPGRIFYSLDYKGLDQDFILEYCEDELNDKTQADTICRVAQTFSSFNFDMLKAMVEEMNRYNEPAQEVIKMLNVRPSEDNYGTFDIKYYLDGVEVIPHPSGYVTTQTDNNPLSEDRIELYIPYPPKPGSDVPTNKQHNDPSELGLALGSDDDDEEYQFRARLTRDNFYSVDRNTGGFIFRYTSGTLDYTIVFTRHRLATRDYYNAF
jgi:hypothetical protein